MKNTLLTARVIFCMIVYISTACGDGILAYKSKNFHADKDAKLIRYESIDPQGFVTWVTSGGKRIRFEKTQFHIWVELLEALPSTILSTDEISSVTKLHEEMKSFRARFHNARSATDASYAILEEGVQKLANGQVRHNEEWLSLEVYQNRVEVQKQKEIAALKKQREEHEIEKARQLKIAELAAEAERDALEKRRFDKIQNIQKVVDSLLDENRRLNLEIDSSFEYMAKLIRESN